MHGHRKTLASAAAATLAATVAATALTSPAAAAPNPNNPRKMAQAVKVSEIMEHLEELQEIADDNDGNRGAGTSGHEESAEYVEETLQDAGYTTRRQPFDFTYFEVVSSSLVADGATVAQNPMSYTPSTPAGGITAALVAPAVATGCTVGDYAGVAVAGKIAVISRGGCAFGIKAAVAKQAGAAAAVIYNNADGALNGTLGAPGNYVPTTGVTKADGLALLTKTSATLDIQAITEDRSTFNVIAETRKGRSDNVVMLGAHLDSVHDGPGINDNGSGSAAILETAVQLARVNKLNNKVRFAWWGAEELGLLGSEHYVADLQANDPAALKDIATYLNFDMVGSPNYIIGVYDADQSTYPAPVDVPKGSPETEDVLTDWFDSQGQPWVDTPFSGRSDYAAFIEAGVPSSGLFTGADGVKTPAEVALFGGTAGIIYDPNYHTPADDISNIDEHALDVMSDAIAAATITLAQDTSKINGKRSHGKSGKPASSEDEVIEGQLHQAS